MDELEDEQYVESFDPQMEQELAYLNTPPGAFAADLLSEENTARITENTLGMNPGLGDLSLEGTGEVFNQENKEGTFGVPIIIGGDKGEDIAKMYGSNVETLRSESPREELNMFSGKKSSELKERKELIQVSDEGNEIVEKKESENISVKHRRPNKVPLTTPTKNQERVLLLGNVNDLPPIWTLVGTTKAISVAELKNTLTQIDLLKSEKAYLEESLAKTSTQAAEKLKKALDQQNEAERRVQLIAEETQRERQRAAKLEAELDEARFRLAHSKGTNSETSSAIKEPICNALKEALSKGKTSTRQKFTEGLAAENNKLKAEVAELKKMMVEQKKMYEKRLAKNSIETRITPARRSPADKNSDLPCVMSALKSGRNLSKILNSEEGCTLLRMCTEISSLKWVIEKEKQGQVTKAMESITEIFETSGNIGGIFKELIDPIMQLTNLVTPKIVSKTNATRLVDEIQGKILAEIDKLNTSDQVKVATEPSPVTQIPEETEEEDEEVYWSDFSDENYAQDDQEDYLAVKAVTELQKWVASSQFTAESIQKAFDPRQTHKISARKLMEALQRAECSCDTELLYAFIRKLEIDKSGKIEYKDLVANLKEKPVAWWTEYIHNNAFDQRNRISRKGNIATLAWPCMYSFVKEGVIEKLQKITGAWNLINVFKDRFEGREIISKSEFRKAVLDFKLPLDREETRVLFSMLDDKNEGITTLSKILTFLNAPDTLPKQKIDKEPTDKLADIYEKIAQYLYHTKTSLCSLFRFYDYNHNHKLAYETFLEAVKSGKLPINSFEARTVFQALQDPEDGLINYEDFVEKVSDLLLALKDVGDSENQIITSVRDLKFKLQQYERENKELKKQATLHRQFQAKEEDRVLKESNDTLNFRRKVEKEEEEENISPEQDKSLNIKHGKTQVSGTKDTKGTLSMKLLTMFAK